MEIVREETMNRWYLSYAHGSFGCRGRTRGHARQSRCGVARRVCSGGSKNMWLRALTLGLIVSCLFFLSIIVLPFGYLWDYSSKIAATNRTSCVSAPSEPSLGPGNSQAQSNQGSVCFNHALSSILFAHLSIKMIEIRRTTLSLSPLPSPASRARQHADRAHPRCVL